MGKLMKELTVIKEEKIAPCTRSELEEVIVGLKCFLNQESDYYKS